MFLPSPRRLLGRVLPAESSSPLVVRFSGGQAGTIMTMGRRKRRQEDDPENDAHNFGSPPASKRRRRRRPSAATLGAAGVADVGDVDNVALDRRDGGSAAVLVSGLPSGCTVLELKSRMQMYGTISRIRIDGEGGLGYVTYRSPDSARAAMSASGDPAFGIVIRSLRVHVSQVSDPVPQWHTGLGVFSPSKLLKAELPLRKHGRGNRKLSEGTSCNRSTTEMPYEGRPIVAYDDLL